MEMNFRINRKEKSGFTLIELIVVITVLAVLAAVAVPMISSYTGKASSAVCLENRGMLIRTYAIHTMTNPDDGFDTFYSTEYGAELLCPSGGEFTYVIADNSLTCSVHDDGEEGAGPGDDGNGAGIMVFPDGSKAEPTGTWADALAEAGDNKIWWNTGVASGDIFYEEGEFYVATSPGYWGFGDTHPSVHPNMAKIDQDNIIRPVDYDNGAQVELYQGRVRLMDNGDLYVYIGGYEGPFGWDDPVVGGGGWSKLDKI